MISISKPMKNSKYCDYSTEMVKANYYANCPEQKATWCGMGAEHLGIKREMNTNDLRRLMEGYRTDKKQSWWDIPKIRLDIGLDAEA